MPRAADEPCPWRSRPGIKYRDMSAVARAVFSVEDRERVRDRVLALADADERVVAGAVVGSSCGRPGDRWSDLDLTVRGRGRRRRHGRARPTGRGASSTNSRRAPLRPPARRARCTASSCSRVCLQLDLSFTPAASFGAAGPRFRLPLRRGDREPARAAARPARALRVRGAPRAPRPLLPRARPLLAGRVLGQRRARLRAQPRVPVCAGCPRAKAAASTISRATCATASPEQSQSSLERDELLRALGTAIDGLLHEAGELAAEGRARVARMTD